MAVFDAADFVAADFVAADFVARFALAAVDPLGWLIVLFSADFFLTPDFVCRVVARTIKHSFLDSIAEKELALILAISSGISQATIGISTQGIDLRHTHKYDLAFENEQIEKIRLMELNQNLRWRYATKKFDPDKKLSTETVTSILESANLTATSYGLQPYRFILLENQELQEDLVASSYGQRQVADASHVIIIAIRTDVDPQYIRSFIDLKENQRNLTPGAMEAYGNQMIKAIMGMSQQQRLEWAGKQAYLAMGTLLVACALHQIDACPMEGFVPQEYNQKLGLTQQNLHAQLVLPIGYRAEDDSTQHLAKVRRPLEDMVIRMSAKV